MMQYALPAAYVLFLWWFSTGAILVVLNRSWAVQRTTLVLSNAVLALALSGLFASAGAATVWGAYCAFTCALLIWGWHELTFLTGVITGPRRTPCPPEARGRRRFLAAAGTVIHHEVAIAATALVLAVLTWGQPNQVGLWTFLVLWVMRLSAKLNIFLGVSKLAEEFLPAHLRYLKSYFRRARINWLLPIAVGVSAWVVWRLATGALDPAAAPAMAVGLTLVATLLALAILEHLFFVLPIPDTALWRWALRRRADLGPRDAAPHGRSGGTPTSEGQDGPTLFRASVPIRAVPTETAVR